MVLPLCVTAPSYKSRPITNQNRPRLLLRKFVRLRCTAYNTPAPTAFKHTYLHMYSMWQLEWQLHLLCKFLIINIILQPLISFAAYESHQISRVGSCKIHLQLAYTHMIDERQVIADFSNSQRTYSIIKSKAGYHT